MVFSQRPVPPVPDFARASTEALEEWLAPLVWHTWRRDYWPQTYAFIAWKGLIFVIAAVLLLVIIKKGEFWLVRKVTGPRGSMLVVKATDAPLMAAAIFVGVDAVYRGLSIHWWLGPKYNYHKNELVWEAMRLFPAWMTAHIHLASSSLVWPLPAHRVHPWLWHSFLLGIPVAFFTAFVPPVIISSNHCAKTYHLWEQVEASLVARPGQVPTAQDIELAQAVHVEATITAHYLAIWCLVGAIFVAITLCGSAIVGWTLSRRVANARRKLEVEPQPATLSGDTIVGGPASPFTTAAYGGSDRRSNVGDQEAGMDESVGATSWEASDSGDVKRGRAPRAAHSTKRMIKYLLGVSPIRGTEPEVLRKPVTPESARRVLRTFHFHLVLETVSLVSLLTLIFSIVVYLLARAYETVYANELNSTFGNGFMKVAYIYHIAEMWGVVTFGSTFAISVLYRSAFPTKIDTVTVSVATAKVGGSDGRHRRGSSAARKSASNGTPSSHIVELSSEESVSPKRLSVVLDSAKTAVRKLPSIRRPKTTGGGGNNDASSTHSSETQSNVPLAGAHSTSSFAPGSFGRMNGPALLEGHRSNLADAGSFAGMGVGRSIVLEALSAGTVASMTQRRKAAWRTQPFSFDGAADSEAVGLGVLGGGGGSDGKGDIERSASLLRRPSSRGMGDLERSPSSLRRPTSRGMFATPHGLVEGVTTSPSTTMAGTPQTMHMTEFNSPSVYATPSPRTGDGFWGTVQRH